MKNVLISGASGFIGQALVCNLLNKGINVYAIVRNAESLSNLTNHNLHIIEGDFEFFDKLKEKIPKDIDIDVFYHLLWTGGVFGPAFKDYRLQLKNIEFACDALVLANELKCKKFVNVGTVNEYEIQRYIQKAEDNMRYTCLYSSAKLAADLFCKTLASNKGIKYQEAVLAKVYGEGDTSNTVVNIVIQNLLKRESPKLIEGDNLYDFIYIQDAAEALYRLGSSAEKLEKYYVGNIKVDTFKNFMISLRNIIAPEIPLQFGSYIDESKIDYNLIDTFALYNETGFIASDSFEENIKNTVKWVERMNVKNSDDVKKCKGGGV